MDNQKQGTDSAADAFQGELSKDLAAFTKPGGSTARKDERAAKRYPSSGRARVVGSNGIACDGKMFDISRSGACVTLENRIPMGLSYSLTIAVFKAGKTHNFTVQAKCVHATLVGDMGFKHGFEFERPSDAALKSISALTDSTGAVFS